MDNIQTVAIVGGGVSGAVIAVELADIGVDTVIFEKKKSLVNGPPFCHLHAGGNLYPDISDEQCRILMKQSIEMARSFPQSIDERPTFISVQKSEDYKVENITNRLEMLRSYYQTLIAENLDNEILGTPENYYTVYTREELLHLGKQNTVERPTTPDQWVTNAIKLIDLEQLKMPVILVQEYGWNFFRLAAQVQLALNKSDKTIVKLNTEVLEVKDVRDRNLAYNWEVITTNEVYKVKYVVNSCGYKTGTFDESLKFDNRRLIEFKASYVSKWKPLDGLIPELIFHGKRGSDNGMAQLTPSANDYYQLHGMTRNITLFKNGLMTSENNILQPEFSSEIKQKLELGWKQEEIQSRTESAIDFVARFVPTFKSAVVGGPPLYGAQQIPGDDPDLRVGEVSFPSDYYARSEIVKASSALTVATQIIEKLQEENVIPLINIQSHNNLLQSVTKNEIDNLAAELTVQRGFPEVLSTLMIEK
jgi:hypothetical protein